MGPETCGGVNSDMLDYEAEVGSGDRTRRPLPAAADALEHIAGFSCEVEIEGIGRLRNGVMRARD